MHLGSCAKVNCEAAMRKAREMKAEAVGYDGQACRRQLEDPDQAGRRFIKESMGIEIK